MLGHVMWTTQISLKPPLRRLPIATPSPDCYLLHFSLSFSQVPSLTRSELCSSLQSPGKAITFNLIFLRQQCMHSTCQQNWALNPRMRKKYIYIKTTHTYTLRDVYLKNFSTMRGRKWKQFQGYKWFLSKKVVCLRYKYIPTPLYSLGK